RAPATPCLSPTPPPPPVPTLFPYTTLFRSRHEQQFPHRAPPRPGAPGPGRDPRRLDGDLREPGHPRRPPAQPPREGGRRRRERLDRKSTRLNSSHDQTSYAVFCLKKKKKQS